MDLKIIVKIIIMLKENLSEKDFEKVINDCLKESIIKEEDEIDKLIKQIEKDKELKNLIGGGLDNTEENLIKKMENMNITRYQRSRRECVKVANLRKIYNKDINLQKWLEDKNNLYCGRHGRIFIDKKIFHYQGSKWENPFKEKEFGLDECIRLYKDYILKKIAENPKFYNVDELKNKKLGCFCDPEQKCHVDILLDILYD